MRTNRAESSIAMPATKMTSDEQQRDRQQPGPAHRDARGEREDQHHDDVQQQVEGRRQHHRERDHEPRKVDLAHDRLAVDDGADGAERGLGEEREHDDVGEQDHRVVLDRSADLDDLA